MSHKIKSTIRFNASIEPSDSDMIFTLPKKASAKLPTRGPLLIEGTINALPFRGALAPDKNESHRLVLPKEKYDPLKLGDMDSVPMEITKAADEIEIRVPEDLGYALECNPKAKATWDDITPIARRDWVFWLISTRNEDTRKRRIEKMTDMLSSGKRRVCCFAGIHWLGENRKKANGK